MIHSLTAQQETRRLKISFLNVKTISLIDMTFSITFGYMKQNGETENEVCLNVKTTSRICFTTF